MRVAVVTPYYKEPIEVLERCHNSVLAQTHTNTHHIMVADGFPNARVEAWSNITHFAIPNCGDYGDTPRGIGSAVAACQGYDAIAFLDADCWYEAEHISNMLTVMQTERTPVVTSPRNLYRMDGTFLCEDKESDGINFSDTNCYLIHREAFGFIRAWMLKDKRQSVIGDRYVWAAIKQSGIKVGRTLTPTINYKTEFAVHYIQQQEDPPKGAKIIVNIDNQMQVLDYEHFKMLVAEQKFRETYIKFIEKIIHNDT